MLGLRTQKKTAQRLAHRLPNIIAAVVESLQQFVVNLINGLIAEGTSVAYVGKHIGSVIIMLK